MTKLTFIQEPLNPDRFFAGEIVLAAQSLTKICGDNGVGKSTFFNYCQSRAQHLFNKPISFLDQKPIRPLNNFSLKEVEMILKNSWQQHLLPDWQKLWLQMLQQLELKPTLRVHELSGGQNQLLKLMITSLLNVEIFLWDEPFQALDPKRVAWWMHWIEQKIHQQKTIVIIDHSDKLDHLAQSIYRLEYLDMNHVYFKKVKS